MAKLHADNNAIFISHQIAGQLVPVTLVDATDLSTLETSVSSPTMQISKNGAAWASLSDGTWAEVGNGVYTVRLNLTDTGSLGWLMLRVIKSGVSAESHVLCHVGTSPADMRSSYQRLRTLHRTGK
jgi:hypothetical protein|tara:strand:+ start:104 stop:481 length:378 start_codon:yes stop_codon:yes gene_type:complete